MDHIWNSSGWGGPKVLNEGVHPLINIFTTVVYTAWHVCEDIVRV